MQDRVEADEEPEMLSVRMSSSLDEESWGIDSDEMSLAPDHLLAPEYRREESEGSIDQLQQDLRQLRELIQSVQDCADVGTRMNIDKVSEQLTRVPITDDIALSVRNIGGGDAKNVEELARLLRRLGKL